jgi:heat shock protein HtpX
LILAALLYSLGFSAIFVIGLTGAMLLAQWWFSDSLALAAMRAVVVEPAQAPQLHAMVDRLCALADMDKPRIGIADSDVPNAFATGRTPKRSVVVVTARACCAGSTRPSSRACSPTSSPCGPPGRDGHDGGVVHRDPGRLHGPIGDVGTVLRDRRDQTAIVFLVVMLVSFLVYFISFVLIRALSRYRELRCRPRGALLTPVARRPWPVALAEDPPATWAGSLLGTSGRWSR